MAKKKKAAGTSTGFVVIKDAKGNIYISELDDPVTDGLTKSDRDVLVGQFNKYRKTAAGKAASADAVLVDSATGSYRILEQGTHLAGGDDDGKKKKKS